MWGEAAEEFRESVGRACDPVLPKIVREPRRLVPIVILAELLGINAEQAQKHATKIGLTKWGCRVVRGKRVGWGLGITVDDAKKLVEYWKTMSYNLPEVSWEE